jgi:hypothetical protein
MQRVVEGRGKRIKQNEDDDDTESIEKLQDGELIVIGKVDDNGYDRLLNENEIQIAKAEIVNHIASYLNKNDLVNFAMVNGEYNNILSKRVAYEREKYNYDKYLKHNIMVTLMYIMVYTRFQYDNYKYILTCVDVYSRDAQAIPLRSE